MLFAATGCVGARSSASPALLPVASQSETASLSASPSAPPTITPTITPTATVATTYDLSNLPLAPTGAWKSIHWVQVPATPLVALPSPEPGTSVQTINKEFKVAGWSRGFVGFSLQSVTTYDSSQTETQPGTTLATINTTYSSDGVHWHDGTVLQLGVSIDNLAIRGVFEGPSGLLAVGESGACGTSWIEALWTSGDGVSWQKVDTKKAFGKATIENVSGGSSGFVAVDDTGRSAWTSRDGQSWRPVTLDTPAGSRIDDGTAFSGGYVLVGSTEAVGARSCGATTADPSASPTPAPPLRSPAVWWSADGATWTKAQLPGATSAYAIGMNVRRASDRTLIALDYYAGPSNGSSAWVSNNGRTWTLLSQPSGLRAYDLVTDGQHSVQVDLPDSTAGASSSSNALISMVTDNGGLVAVAQNGDMPPSSRPGDLPQGYFWQEQWAVGPTGILVTDGSQLWIGLPSQG
jgi:hypothetical protein